jgi:hypothetical protein
MMPSSTARRYHDLIGRLTQQDVELDKLYGDVCVYNTRVMGPDHVENVVISPAGRLLDRRRMGSYPTVTIPDRRPCLGPRSLLGILLLAGLS